MGPPTQCSKPVEATVPGGIRDCFCPQSISPEQALEDRLLKYAPSLCTFREAIQHLQSSKVVAATDGSYDAFKMQAAGSWTLSTRNRKWRISGTCSVDGDTSTLSSYRAELEAIRSLVFFLQRLRSCDNSFAADI